MTGLRTALILLLVAALSPVAAGQEEKSDEKPAVGSTPGGRRSVKDQPAESKPDPTARFWEARRVMLTGRSRDAAELFRSIARDHPDADVGDDCLYWMGRCYLRIDDREPDAVVAFKRIVTKLPKSPFVDDAARELMRLSDRTMVAVLAPRLALAGVEAELAARALAELDDPRGVEWLAKHKGEAPAPAPSGESASEPKKPAAPAPKPSLKVSELDELKAEIRRLRQELDESVRLLESLLAERAEEKKTEEKNAEDKKTEAETGKTDTKSETESEKKK